jgi:hypothetical protein
MSSAVKHIHSTHVFVLYDNAMVALVGLGHKLV